jgi:hypothetical protein
MYNYQKWRWLAAHMAEHSKAQSLRHRRIAAEEKRIQEKKKHHRAA